MTEYLRHTGQMRILKLKGGGAIHILCLDGGVPLAMVEASPPGMKDMLKEAYDKGFRYATCLETPARLYTRWKFHQSLSKAEEEAERLAGKRIRRIRDKQGKARKYFEEEAEEEWSMS